MSVCDFSMERLSCFLPICPVRSARSACMAKRIHRLPAERHCKCLPEVERSKPGWERTDATEPSILTLEFRTGGHPAVEECFYAPFKAIPRPVGEGHKNLAYGGTQTKRFSLQFSTFEQTAEILYGILRPLLPSRRKEEIGCCKSKRSPILISIWSKNLCYHKADLLVRKLDLEGGYKWKKRQNRKQNRKQRNHWRT